MMQIKDYLLVKSLGKGSFGEVFLTKKGKSSKLYATKKIPSSKLLNKDFKKYLENEINIMKQLEHENIIKYHESYQTSHNIYIIMDYINGGNLSEYLTKYKLKNGHPFSQAMIQYFVKQIVEGLIYIHRKNIIHRDIKLENILLQIPNHTNADLVDYSLTKVKIIDFGLSTQSNLATSFVGSPIYMDPNILKKYEKSGGTEKFKSYDKKADIWSLGAITYEMLTGHNVFNASSLPELLNKVKKGDYTLEVNCLSNEILSFLNGMLQNDPEKRATAKQLLEHPFLTKNPSDFRKIDTSKIDYKIDKYGFLTINIINNETIGKEFPFFKPLSINLELISDKFSEKNRTEI
jgi:serine/threonine protein kinase